MHISSYVFSKECSVNTAAVVIPSRGLRAANILAWHKSRIR